MQDQIKLLKERNVEIVTSLCENENTDITTRHTPLDLQAEAIKEELSTVTQVNNELSCKMQAQSWALGHLENENKELKELNASLMQDNELYEVLLREKTCSGDIIGTEIFKRSKKPRSSILSLDQELKKCGENDVENLKKENTTMQEEIRALGFYITRIVGKIGSDEMLDKLFNCLDIE